MKAIPLSKRGAAGLTTLVDDCDVFFCESRRIFIGNEGKYPTITLWRDGKKHVVALHRALLGLWPGDGIIVDHINGNRFDNRRTNLRTADAAKNAANRSPSSRNLAGLKGVSTYGKKYGAKISGEYLGRFDTADAAARAYDDAARTRFGAFAALNFPGPGEIPCRRTPQDANASEAA